jgi:hypothetical protein
MIANTRTTFRIALPPLLRLLLPSMISVIMSIIHAESIPGVEPLIAAAASNMTTSEGKEFYIAFGPGYDTDTLLVSISSAHAPAQITIEEPGTGNSNLQVAADSSVVHILPQTIRQENANVSQPKVVKIASSSSLVTVSGLANSEYVGEAYLALPLEALGTRYIVPGIWSSLPYSVGFLQIITTDAQLVTNITITTRVSTSSGSAGTYQLALGPRMAWLLTTTGLPHELGGTEITGSAPFGVKLGHECTTLPPGE